MAREEDKHRGAEYVPHGPVRISAGLSPTLADAFKRIEVLEAQVRSLQLQLANGVPVP